MQDRKAIRLFVMLDCRKQTGEWRGFDVWPPPVKPSTYYFHADSRLASTAAPLSPHEANFVYDPAGPTPHMGGKLFSHKNAGAVDVRSIEDRADILVFTTAPMAKDTSIVGRSLVLFFVFLFVFFLARDRGYK